MIAHYIQQLRKTLRASGLAGTLATIAKLPLASTGLFCERVLGRSGLEIGGPSPFFRTFLPIYESVARLDNCVFNSTTIWEGEIKQAFAYHPAKPLGRNYITEATDLHHFADACYDFVLACHCLEHIANPIKALKEWIRVVRPGGPIILVLPEHRRTFDHLRPITPVSHMLDDYHADVGEDDATHIEEVLAKHDLRRDPDAGSWKQFRERSLKNLQLRGLHHHVFNTQNIRQLCETVGLGVKVIETALPHHMAVLTVTRG